MNAAGSAAKWNINDMQNTPVAVSLCLLLCVCVLSGHIVSSSHKTTHTSRQRRNSTWTPAVNNWLCAHFKWSLTG